MEEASLCLHGSVVFPVVGGCCSDGWVGRPFCRTLVVWSPAPPFWMLKCLWARYWTPNWNNNCVMGVWVCVCVCVCVCITPDEQVDTLYGSPCHLFLNVDMYFKALGVVDRIEKHRINVIHLPKLSLTCQCFQYGTENNKAGRAAEALWGAWDEQVRSVFFRMSDHSASINCIFISCCHTSLNASAFSSFTNTSYLVIRFLWNFKVT